MIKKGKKDSTQKKENTAAIAVDSVWATSWTYIKTVVDIAHEPFLILDKDLNVLAANSSFYRTFQTDVKDTEGELFYDLGNKQWDIPSLRKLLEDILPKNTFFKGYEVAHDFPVIGRKVMILNARRIYNDETISGALPPIILLAINDATDLSSMAEKLANINLRAVETKFSVEIEKMEMNIGKLKKEILKLKKKA